MKKLYDKIPFHIKGSKAQYKRFRGKMFILEEVIRPCDLKDSDYVDKQLLYENIYQVARHTIREEIAQNIPSYFNRANLIYIVSDLNHKIVAFSACSSMFEDGDFVMIMWLSICLEEYRQKGLLKALIPKMFLYYLREYNQVKGYTGIKRLIPFFTENYMFVRTFNPLVYQAILASPMNISPTIDKNGEIDISKVSERDISIRKRYLRKIGYAENKINENLFILQKILKNENENKITHANIPACPKWNVNKFFEDNLGLDKGNALLVAAFCRPAPAMVVFFPERLLKTLWRMTRDGFKFFRTIWSRLLRSGKTE